MFNNLGDNGRLLKFVTLTFILLSVFLAVLAVNGLKNFSYIGKQSFPPATITASGEGEAFAVPDIATFSFGADESADTVKDAQTKVDTTINKALDILKKAGVADKDIQTSNYNAYPKYEWTTIECIKAPCPPGHNVLTGYEVSEMITVKVRDTSKAGDLITQIGTTGANNISGLQFTVDDEEKYTSQAREQAVAKAKTSAEQTAKDLGMSLGKVVSFSENGATPIYYGVDAALGMGGDMKAASVPSAAVPTGQNKIVSNVSITYELR